MAPVHVNASPVHGTGGPQLQRKCACEETGETCSRCASKAMPAHAAEVAGSAGTPLDQGTLGEMQSRFGRDFSQVRVHTDPRAAASARALDARAYTYGPHIAFANGRFSPGTSEGKRLLAHELTHVAQQSAPAGAARGSEAVYEQEADEVAGRVASGGSSGPAVTAAPVGIARAPGDAASRPALEPLAQELMRELLNARRTAPPAIRPPTAAEAKAGQTAAVHSMQREARRTFAAAAVYDAEGNRLALFTRFYDDKLASGLHAEQQIVAEIKAMMSRGEKVAYTVMMVDQDPCPGICTPMLQEFISDPAVGTFRTMTPKSTYRNDPTRETSAKTGYTRAVAQDETMSGIRLNPENPAAGEAFVKSRAEGTQVRLPIYKGPPDGTVVPPVTGSGAPGAAADAVEGAVEKQVAAKALQAGEKDVGEAAAKGLTSLLMSKAEGKVASHFVPGVGAAFSIGDMLKGLADITHGNVGLGAATVGVAGIEALSHFLHLTDEFTAGGGTALALTIQGWTTAMQLGFESVRVTKRSQELMEYIRKHDGGLPPRDELMSYYGLNDEGILILENDIWRARRPEKMSAAAVRDQTRGLLAKLESQIRDKQLSLEDAEQLRAEREALGALLVFFTRRAVAEEQRVAAENKKEEDKRSKQKLAQLRTQTQQAAAAGQQQAPASLPTPAPQNAPAQFRPFGAATLPGSQTMSPSDQTVAVAEMLEQEKDALISQADAIRSSEDGARYREALKEWIDKLNKVTDYWMKKGSPEWPGVQRMRKLQDQVKNELFNRLRVGTL
jgi:hypothetical protein